MEIVNNPATILEMLADPSRREQGFRLLMRQYGKSLYWHIRRIVVGHDDAEDVLQDTFIKVLGNIGQYKGEGQLSAWLYRIATNEALASLRRQTRLFQRIDSLGPLLAERMEAEAPVDADRAELLFQKAVLLLPTQQRIAFNLRYYDELSYEEIAQVTGKKVGTLKTNYHYAVEKIKTYIKEHTS
ncbi:MAG: RNA polymerase sigma factor [Prevotella sp.]|nr:RNA polymerase sigma factor [Prevotella sp.]